ncbi:hypothetical protein PC9H_011406 [Pleurotus ostreatus]|uniref:Uncharacterized protein n=1 Tax=Pleurotus ostreatus TaxID=5322 RepID=A0A8H6ZL03_PLEOS|nr:uncharacterized protein PC9H_011406 [Pleurotus ostreatus]KAF7420888.1 hypothetical protein PC9H_011406 [Pleurotus ostreatus]
MLSIVYGVLSLPLLVYCSAKLLGSEKAPNTYTFARGYVLRNRVTHQRLLPEPSSHRFVYPTVCLLVSLSALERGALDVGRGWLFGYGGVFGRLTGLRPGPYLTAGGSTGNGSSTIRERLVRVLTPRFGNAAELLEDAWMMTMPSFLGFEGINPLTVYFCYKSTGEFWLCVLEVRTHIHIDGCISDDEQIHNTFGESHVHVLEVGQREDAPPSGSVAADGILWSGIPNQQCADRYDHQWTFRREFHVSPFNDRSGFYTVAIKQPNHPPMAPPSDNKFPLPVVRVQLYTDSDSDSAPDSPGPLKLVAVLRCTSSAPLTAPSLLSALLWAPLGLLLSFPRILYHAWILHYVKRLDVFLRPEPFPANPDWAAGATNPPKLPQPAGVKWQSEGILERSAKRRVVSFLRQRAGSAGISVSLVSADPATPREDFPLPSGGDSKAGRHLQIDYLAPRFFTILFLSPSAAHALLLGHTSDKVFFPSSAELFLEVFSAPLSSVPPLSAAQQARLRGLPHSLQHSLALPIPPTHPLDLGWNATVTWSMVKLLRTLEEVERWIFSIARARPVKGDEPWKQWERAEHALTSREDFGTLRREQEGYEHGSVRSG